MSRQRHHMGMVGCCSMHMGFQQIEVHLVLVLRSPRHTPYGKAALQGTKLISASLIEISSRILP